MKSLALLLSLLLLCRSHTNALALSTNLANKFLLHIFKVVRTSLELGSLETIYKLPIPSLLHRPTRRRAHFHLDHATAIIEEDFLRVYHLRYVIELTKLIYPYVAVEMIVELVPRASFGRWKM